MSDIEYSVIMSDVIKSFDCTRSALAKVTQVIISKGKRGMEHTKRLILKKVS